MALAAMVYFAITVQATAFLHECTTIVAACSPEQHPAEEANFPCDDPKQCKLAARHKFGEASVKAPRATSSLLSWLFSTSQFARDPGRRRLDLQVSTPPDIPGVSLFVLHRVFRI